MTDTDEAPALEPLADGSGFRTRVRYGKRRNRFRIPSTDREFARTRSLVLRDLGQLLGSAPPEVAASILTRAGAADGRELAKLQAAAKQLHDGARVVRKQANARESWTVRELGEAWTDGTLAKDFPDQIKARRSMREDISRLEAHVYPVIGDLAVRAVTLETCERVMRSLKPHRNKRKTPLAPNTRRHVALVLHRLLTLAAYPLKIIPTNPIPKGFLPHAGTRKAYAYLYPSEDRALMRCKSIPLGERVFFGFLNREGCRAGEALAMTWADFDLKRGAVRLDENKTDDPRTWALAPGVAKALEKLRPRRSPANGLVFPQPRDPNALARDLRRRLRDAGIDRPELFESSKARAALRAHDLRASFVTIALANGKTETWVADRTGHRSSQMISRYRRQARTAAELGLGDWVPLDVALGLRKSAPTLTPRSRRSGAGRNVRAV